MPVWWDIVPCLSLQFRKVLSCAAPVCPVQLTLVAPTLRPLTLLTWGNPLCNLIGRNKDDDCPVLILSLWVIRNSLHFNSLWWPVPRQRSYSTMLDITHRRLAFTNLTYAIMVYSLQFCSILGSAGSVWLSGMSCVNSNDTLSPAYMAELIWGQLPVALSSSSSTCLWSLTHDTRHVVDLLWLQDSLLHPALLTVSCSHIITFET